MAPFSVVTSSFRTSARAVAASCPDTDATSSMVTSAPTRYAPRTGASPVTTSTAASAVTDDLAPASTAPGATISAGSDPSMVGSGPATTVASASPYRCRRRPFAASTCRTQDASCSTVRLRTTALARSDFTGVSPIGSAIRFNLQSEKKCQPTDPEKGRTTEQRRLPGNRHQGPRPRATRASQGGRLWPRSGLTSRPGTPGGPDRCTALRLLCLRGQLALGSHACRRRRR
jgi:hypothetical protein